MVYVCSIKRCSRLGCVLCVGVSILFWNIFIALLFQWLSDVSSKWKCSWIFCWNFYNWLSGVQVKLCLVSGSTQENYFIQTELKDDVNAFNMVSSHQVVLVLGVWKFVEIWLKGKWAALMIYHLELEFMQSATIYRDWNPILWGSIDVWQR